MSEKSWPCLGVPIPIKKKLLFSIPVATMHTCMYHYPSFCGIIAWDEIIGNEASLENGMAGTIARYHNSLYCAEFDKCLLKYLAIYM